jgi:hypothetical protein
LGVKNYFVALLNESPFMANQHMSSRQLLVFSVVIGAGLSASAAEVSAKQWKAHMERIVPLMLCANDSPVRQCLAVTDDQCTVGLARTTRICIAKLGDKIPAQVSLPKQGEELGGDVGDCAEDLFVIENAATLKNLPQCTEYKQVIQKGNAPSK